MQCLRWHVTANGSSPGDMGDGRPRVAVGAGAATESAPGQSVLVAVRANRGWDPGQARRIILCGAQTRDSQNTPYSRSDGVDQRDYLGRHQYTSNTCISQHIRYYVPWRGGCVRREAGGAVRCFFSRACGSTSMKEQAPPHGLSWSRHAYKSSCGPGGRPEVKDRRGTQSLCALALQGSGDPPGCRA